MQQKPTKKNKKSFKYRPSTPTSSNDGHEPPISPRNTLGKFNSERVAPAFEELSGGEEAAVLYSEHSSPAATDYTEGYDSMHTSGSIYNAKLNQSDSDEDKDKEETSIPGAAHDLASPGAPTEKHPIHPRTRGRPRGSKNQPRRPITSPQMTTRSGKKRQRSNSPSSPFLLPKYDRNTSITSRTPSPVKKQRNDASTAARKPQKTQSIFMKDKETEQPITAEQPDAGQTLSNLGSDLASFLAHLKNESTVRHFSTDLLC